MKDYLIKDEWKIIEDKWRPEYHQISESIFSLGNGQMGQRANHEETYTGPHLQGSYVAGVYYPDKTKVGWWKNGYPEYFAKVLNAVNWIGLRITIDGHEVDLNHSARVVSFYRELDMQVGVLTRRYTYDLPVGRMVVEATRFVSMSDKELGCMQYSLAFDGYEGSVEVESYLDFDVSNQDANYDEKFWVARGEAVADDYGFVMAETLKTGYQVAAAMANRWTKQGEALDLRPAMTLTSTKFTSQQYQLTVADGDTITLHKYAVIASTRYHDATDLKDYAIQQVGIRAGEGWRHQFLDHTAQWERIWDMCDVTIGGDIAAQQGIRFNIFQLYQTYTGDDARLNIGPKGFTGEKYGGSTYWDTEAYCLPFYLGTADPTVARNLLVYRYNHLDKAIENAEKLGFDKGAALYPMVTMNGEECHNEWEITFEEIHRNGAIAYAIKDYIDYTDDRAYLADYGLEVLIGIARFWSQRVHLSPKRDQYVMLGVTGPNEYENNVNNNWYTNYIAVWCLAYATDAMDYVQEKYPQRWAAIKTKVNWQAEELTRWTDIRSRMYFPEDEDLGIMLQQDNYLDKEDLTVTDLPASARPINQQWSWDRILRSPFIKQADVLQGMYFFESDFDVETIRRNFLYYEPRTVHESSLSPCVHSILACVLDMPAKAYEMYLRTSRLDLDDYNNDTEDGCHITSMAGTWLAVIKGFAGQRVRDGVLSFDPKIPAEWRDLSFKILYRGVMLKISMSHGTFSIENYSGQYIHVMVRGTDYEIKDNASLDIEL
jgi:maltose phosphorylase